MILIEILIGNWWFRKGQPKPKNLDLAMGSQNIEKAQEKLLKLLKTLSNLSKNWRTDKKKTGALRNRSKKEEPNEMERKISSSIRDDRKKYQLQNFEEEIWIDIKQAKEATFRNTSS